MIPFVKTHALGNDFLLVERPTTISLDYPDVARRICHRYFGVGADGLILWQPAGSRNFISASSIKMAARRNVRATA